MARLPYASPSSTIQWAMDYLAYIGAPASGVNDPRVKFLASWENEEGTFTLGNQNNPLDTMESAPNAGQWNAQGVKTYPTLREGLMATLETMQQGYDAPILQALKNPASTEASLVSALSSSNWTGGGANSQSEEGYAATIAGVPAQGPTANPNSSPQAETTATTSLFGIPIPSALTKSVAEVVMRVLLEPALAILFAKWSFDLIKAALEGREARKSDPRVVRAAQKVKNLI